MATIRADARANRRALVEAARRLYATRGTGVPMSTVAQEAGVGIATLYRHFPTPQDLIAGVGTHLRDEVVGVCHRSLPLLREDPERGWRAFVDEVVALRLGAFVPQVIDELSTPEFDELFAAIRADFVAALTEVLDVAKAEGLLRADVDPLRFHIGLGSLTRPLPAAADRYVPGEMEWLVDVFLRGIRP